jgi:hypothetical protein
MKKVFLGALAICALSAVQASAVTIDFSDNVWNPGFNDSKTVGNTTVESVPQIPLGILDWDTNDGFGVASWANPNGQVGFLELLDISFAQSFTLSAFSITELERNCGRHGCDSEVGYYRVNGGPWQSFTATSSSGNLLVNLAPIAGVTSLQFGLSGISSDDFRVKSLTGEFSTQPSAVPEPTSMVLLSTGLVGLATRLRRKKA